MSQMIYSPPALLLVYSPLLPENCNRKQKKQDSLCRTQSNLLPDRRTLFRHSQHIHMIWGAHYSNTSLQPLPASRSGPFSGPVWSRHTQRCDKIKWPCRIQGSSPSFSTSSHNNQNQQKTFLLAICGYLNMTCNSETSHHPNHDLFFMAVATRQHG
jgi:hypothetical protein